MKFNFKNVFSKVLLVSAFALFLVVVMGTNKAYAADTCTAATGIWSATGTWSGCTTGGAHVPTSAEV